MLTQRLMKPTQFIRTALMKHFFDRSLIEAHAPQDQ